ncbi:MAG: galactose mutarotase [Oceanospirillaceae bacterium]|nr:galactose mutarotase [Oceanospirillaceae bacterium]
MRVFRAPFGTTESGISVDKFTLINDEDMSVDLITYGGRVTAVRFPDINGEIGNVVLGFDSIESYERDSAYIGALIGRYANRIADAQLRVNGEQCWLGANEGKNQLHGGFHGLHNRVLDAQVFEMADEVGVELSTVLEEGLEGYPGDLEVSIRISLSRENELKFDYKARCNRPTVVNLTHHGYFNLSGVQGGSCMSHLLSINADAYTPVNGQAIPTGEIRAVEGTVYDFRQAKRLDQDSGAAESEPQGFDHNFVLNKQAQVLAEAAWLKDPLTGREVRLFTTEPGLQLYTAQYLDSVFEDKRVRFGPYSGVCLEAQHFANSPNEPAFPSTLLLPQETYRQTTIYRFSREEM